MAEKFYLKKSGAVVAPVTTSDAVVDKTTGNSIDEIMLKKSAITQEAGTSEVLVMSQKAVSTELNAYAGFFSHADTLISNGRARTSAGFTATDFILLPTTDFKIWGYDGGTDYSDYSICNFYDKNGTFISKYISGNTSATDGEFTISFDKFPAGSVYFRTNTRTRNLAKSYIKAMNLAMLNSKIKDNIQDITSIIESVTNLNKEIASSELNNFYKSLAFTSIPGKVINTTDGIAVSLSYAGFSDTAYTDYISVTPSQKVLISGQMGLSTGVVGYDSGKHYVSGLCSSVSDTSLFPVEFADNFEITIPEDVYYIRASTKDATNYPIILSMDVDTVLGTVLSKLDTVVEYPAIKIVGVSATEFHVFILQENKKTYLKHVFLRQFNVNTLTYGDDDQEKEVTTSDVWYDSEIYNESNQHLMQGNTNFIYMLMSDGAGFENEAKHVGAGHGCVVTIWQRFTIDGKEFDPTDIGDELHGSVMRMTIKANCYAADGTNPLCNGNSHNVPKLDNNGDPIIAAQHYLDWEARVNNVITHQNRLTIKRDNTSFVQCHAGMVAGYRPYFTDVLIDNVESTWNTHTYIDDVLTVEPAGGSEINLLNSPYHLSSVTTMFGDNVMLKQEMVQKNNANIGKSTAYTVFTPAPNRCKVYQMPVICSQGASALGQEIDVFNAGDVIEVKIIRNIETT